MGAIIARGENMDKQIEQDFSDFMDSHEADNIFENFQDLIRLAYLEGYKSGQKNSNIQIIYITNKKRAED